jgi:UDP-N-acetylmuramoyl-tripeptide--D-alanyl-D-alanine ligase
MSVLWTSRDAESATLGHASRRFEATGLSIDTRTLKPGDLFVALKGEARDGHDFVGAAIAAKAGAALVARAVPAVGPDAAFLTVANTQRGLEDLARAARARSRAQIVAVTGSAGKTTTKEMLRLALGALGPTHVSAASYNNHWGVPLSLAALPQDSAYGVFEIGMNHFGEIRALVGMVRPHVALLTTIAPAHLEFFGNCEAIADAKSEIFEGVLSGGAALIPADSPYTERLRARARQAGLNRVLRFGSTQGSDARLISTVESDGAMKVEADILGRWLHFRIGAPGVHNAANALGALLAVATLDGDVLNAAAALSDFSALKGRGQRFDIAAPGGKAILIDESYNANPASMAAALANLGSATLAKGGRRIAVLGDMLELGPDGAALHAQLAPVIDAARVDIVFLCGAQMAALWDRIPASRRGGYGPQSSDIAGEVANVVRAGDVVLVKGSLGSRMAAIVDALKARTV